MNVTTSDAMFDGYGRPLCGAAENFDRLIAESPYCRTIFAEGRHPPDTAGCILVLADHPHPLPASWIEDLAHILDLDDAIAVHGTDPARVDAVISQIVSATCGGRA